MVAPPGSRCAESFESTRGAKDGGHLDAAVRQRSASNARMRLEGAAADLIGPTSGRAPFCARYGYDWDQKRQQVWISLSTHGDYSIMQSMPAGHANGYTGYTRCTDLDVPNRNSHGGSAPSEFRVQCGALNGGVARSDSPELLPAARARLDAAPRASLTSLCRWRGWGCRARLLASMESGRSKPEQAQCLSWLVADMRCDSGTRCDALAALEASTASQPAVLQAISLVRRGRTAR